MTSATRGKALGLNESACNVRYLLPFQEKSIRPVQPRQALEQDNSSDNS